MSSISEKAIFTNYASIPIGYKVSIIKKEFAKFNPSTFGTYSTNDDKFVDGILVSKAVISTLGYGGIVEYVVKLDNNDEQITFNSSPIEYYFKVNPTPCIIL